MRRILGLSRGLAAPSMCRPAASWERGALIATSSTTVSLQRKDTTATPPAASDSGSGNATELSIDVHSGGALGMAAAVAAGDKPAVVKMTRAQRKRSNLANIQQKPLFPGMFRHVTKFEGEHLYHYGKHTYTIFKESSGIAVLPAGCLLAYCLSWFPSCPVMPLELQLAYLGLLAIASRVVSRGWTNRESKDLTGRTVVVTGGTSGIGRATAARLAAMGANLVILAPDNNAHVEPAMAFINKTKKHKGSAGDTTVSNSNGKGGGGGADAPPPVQTVAFQSLDLSDFIAVRDLCKKWRHQGQPIDILVNCAGVLQEKHVTTRFGDDVQLAVNFLGPYLLTEGLLPLVESTQGRIVYVSCSAHVGIKASSIVNTYLTGRGVWSPRVADRFDGLEQYGFTKLGSIYHSQQLALRSYPEPTRRSFSQRLVAQKDPRLRPAGDNRSPAEIAMEGNVEPHFTTCACTPGGVITNIYRDVPLASAFKWLYYPLLLIMRTATEGSQSVVNCCVRDELKNGGYYMNMSYQPAGLSQAACSVKERQQVMAWTQKKMQPYMRWD